MMVKVMVIMAVALLLLGFPIWLVFLVSSVVALCFFTSMPLVVVPSTLFGCLDNLVLLAVPGFIFAGAVMGRGGMTVRLVDWVYSLMKPVPAGIALTTVAANEVFGTISGSSAAATAALGEISYTALQKSGYPERFSLGMVASSGCIASIIPPSINMILYSSITGCPVGKLFLAGFLPGILIGILVSIYSLYIYYRQGLAVGEKWRWSWTEIWSNTKLTAWTLGTPIIIFAGIYGGFTTPTEAAVLASAYSVFVAAFIYRELNWKGLWDVALEGARLSAKIFVITGSAGLFSYVLTINRVPQSIVSFITATDAESWVILLMINVLLLITGMFIDPVSAILVFTPILWPIAKAIGLDNIHFGIIVTVNLAIGMFTPPFGLNLFVICSILRVSAGRLATCVPPFVFIYVVGLMVITYVPFLSLWLPSLWHM